LPAWRSAPHALGLVQDPALVNAAAEAGVILLMFTIGIEFSLERLSRIKRLIFVGGGLQVLFSCLVTMAVLALAGVDWRTGLFTGFLVSLSSTAIVLKVIGDRGETTTDYGQASIGLLIFQDLGDHHDGPARPDARWRCALGRRRRAGDREGGRHRSRGVAVRQTADAAAARARRPDLFARTVPARRWSPSASAPRG
jgi:hypothetical protein